MKLKRQAGEGIVGCVVWLVIAGAMILLLVRIVPVQIASAELKDFMVEQAKFAGRRTTAEGVHKAILHKARQLGLPVTKKDIKVTVGSGRISMRCTYSVPVDFLVYTYIWDFDHVVNRPVFIV
ncbi:MAG: hypothetical protein O7A98_10630 [Acidobacteria bacterium]|nr:hypothetical protein [Acidobacteriota bacterium]